MKVLCSSMFARKDLSTDPVRLAIGIMSTDRLMKRTWLKCCRKSAQHFRARRKSEGEGSSRSGGGSVTVTILGRATKDEKQESKRMCAAPKEVLLTAPCSGDALN